MKIESFAGNLDINTINMPDVLGKLTAGDVIRAKVLDITANQITLKLFDGTVFNAKTLSSLEAELGDIVDFSVKDNVNGQIVLETLKENEGNLRNTKDANLDLKKQLIDLGIKPDKNSIEIAQAIKQNKIPLDKEIFNKIADTITSFKNITPQKVAYLVANKIAPEKENIALLNKIVDDKQKVGTMLNSTFEALSKLTDKETIQNISRILNDNFNKEIAHSEINSAKSSGQQIGISKDIVESLFSSDSQKNELLLSSAKQKLQEFVSNILDSSSKDVMKLLQDEKQFIDKVVSHLKENVKEFENSDILKDKSIESVAKDLFRKLKTELKEERFNLKNENSPNRIKESDDFKKQLSEVLDKIHVKINEKSTGEDFKVNKLYKEMYKKLEMIKNAVEQSSVLQKDDILDKIGSLQSNLKFINDMNNHSLYMQIPINIQGKNTTGDLYVLKKGNRGKKIDPQNASILVSLNTPNLGQIDSFITFYKKNISLNIRIEDQDIIGVIKESYIQLYNSLLNKGYKLVDVKYRLMEEEVNVINAESVMMKETNLKKQKIDYKI